MERNKLKIVSNQIIRRISYYLKNESNEWVRVPNSSVLSRKEYLETSIKEKINDIIRIIDDIYNPGNRGIDVIFEGTDEEYAIICTTIRETCLSDSISCNQIRTKIAVAGKIGSGKTILIEGIANHFDSKYRKQKKSKYDKFFDNKANTEWYELRGIDLGKEYIAQAKTTLERLAKVGMTVFVYCLSTYKIEKLEEELILDFNKNYPEIKTLIVLTSCVEDDSELFAEQISNQLGQKRVIPVLVKELKTRNGCIPSFGLDQIVRYIYEGK